jgi:tRNA-binding EMAP/Myf-like protein
LQYPEETELVSVKDKEIKFDVFDKVELKVAEVMECKKVEGADKLLQYLTAHFAWFQVCNNNQLFTN